MGDSLKGVNKFITQSGLRAVMEDVRKIVSPATIKKAWLYRYSKGEYEFQIPPSPEFPKGFYWHGRAWDAAEARSTAWGRVLEQAKSSLGGSC